MRRYSTDFANLFLGVFLITLFGFKFNLIEFGGSGIRLDDVLLVLSMPVLIILISRLKIKKEFNYYLIFLGFSFVSLILGYWGGRISLLEGGFYWVRNIQYMCFFFFGLTLSSHANLDRIFRVYLIYVLIFLFLQYFSLIPTFSLFVGSGRAVANTGGPYELAVIASLLALFFWFQSSRKIYLLLAIVVLFLTQSRITLVGLFLIFFIKCFGTRGRVIFAFGSVAVILLFSFVDAGILNRFMLFFDVKTFDSFGFIFRDIPSFSNTWNYREWAFSDYSSVLVDSEGDKSAFIRFIRQYSLLLSIAKCGYECSIFGLGPSFASSAVDGNLVRLFVEYGVVGIILFPLGIWRVVKSTRNTTVISYFWLLLFTAIAIDILVSSKAMSILWFLCGFYSPKNDIRQERINSIELSPHPAS